MWKCIIEKLANLLQLYEWQFVQDDKPGITWIELLNLAELHGIDFAMGAEHCLEHRIPIQQLLDKIETGIKFISMHCMTQEDQQLFHASHAMQQRLRAIGIIHAVPGIRALPMIPESMAEMITTALLKQKGAINTPVAQAAYKNGTLRTPWQELITRGAPKWRNGKVTCIFELPTVSFMAADEVLLSRHLYCPGCGDHQQTYGKCLRQVTQRGTRWLQNQVSWMQYRA